MTYWKELPETFTRGWALNQISAANLMLAIAPKNSRKSLDQDGVDFSKTVILCLSVELGLPISSHMTGHT